MSIWWWRNHETEFIKYMGVEWDHDACSIVVVVCSCFCWLFVLLVLNIAKHAREASPWSLLLPGRCNFPQHVSLFACHHSFHSWRHVFLTHWSTSTSSGSCFLLWSACLWRTTHVVRGMRASGIWPTWPWSRKHSHCGFHLLNWRSSISVISVTILFPCPRLLFSTDTSCESEFHSSSSIIAMLCLIAKSTMFHMHPFLLSLVRHWCPVLRIGCCSVSLVLIGFHASLKSLLDTELTY